MEREGTHGKFSINSDLRTIELSFSNQKVGCSWYTTFIKSCVQQHQSVDPAQSKYISPQFLAHMKINTLLKDKAIFMLMGSPKRLTTLFECKKFLML